jgi:hypothetical protein
MLNKSNTLKSYLRDIGSKNQVFFLFGNTPNNISSNTTTSSIDIWRTSEMSYRVGKKDSIAVVPNRTWAAGNVYNYWMSGARNTDSYYVWNKTNNIVYLCVSNNSLNRKDLSLTNVSTQIPNHPYGLKTYADGYTWLPLYKITADLLRFVNSTWMPVISFDDFRTNDTSKYNGAERFCNGSQSSSINCAVYFNNTSQIETTFGNFTTYNPGQIYLSFRSTCQQCYYLFENDDRYTSVQYSTSIPVPQSIVIKDKFDQIEELVTTNQISTASPYHALYTISANGLPDGGIVSAIIDLSAFNKEDLVIDKANSEITITSSSGSGASLRFITHINTNGEHIIDGVALTNSGEGYKDYHLSIDYSKFPYLSSTQVDQLIASIEINLDILDGLNFDPVAALSAENIMFDIRVETNVLKQEGLSIPNRINFYALVENPIEVLNDGLEITAGSQYGKDNTYVEKTTSKLVLTGIPDPGLEPGIVGEATLDNGNLLSDVDVTNIDTTGGSLKVEINNINYSDVSKISTVTLNSTVYAVDSVEYKPTFKQYSGKVAQTKVLNSPLTFGNATTDTENTKIFRINIVKGF